MSRDRLLAPLIAGLVVLVGAIPRVMLAAGSLPDWARPFIWSDALFTYERGLSGHRLPYRDSFFEYPPALGAIAGAFSLVSPNAVAYVLLWAVLIAAAAGACAYLLRIAGRRNALIYWAAAPQLLVLSSVNFDVLPTTLLVGAAVAARSGRRVMAVVALAVGTSTKLFPLASFPVALLSARGRAVATATFLSVVGAFYLPTSVLPYGGAGPLLFYAGQIRANIDSVWGLAERALNIAGVPGSSTLVLALSLGGLVATYLLHVLPRAVRMPDPAAAFALATIVLMFWSRLYSPQYSLWILPFFALLPIGGRTFALLTLADLGVYFTVYPLTLVRRSPDDPASVALLGALVLFVLVRQLAVVVIWRSILRTGSSSARASSAAAASSSANTIATAPSGPPR